MQGKVTCFSCKTEIAFDGLVGRRDECHSCQSDLHVCLNCEFHDQTAYNECREPSAEVVREKDRSNFCDYFSPGKGGGKAGQSKEDLLKAADALFKKS